MSDEIFIEVAEDIRQQKLREFWVENKYWIIGGVISAIVLTASLSFWRHWEYKRDTQATTELIKVTTNDLNVEALSNFIETTNKNHATIARFLLASSYTKKKENAKATEIYNDITTTKGIDKDYRELAKLLSISIAMDNETSDLKKMEQDLSVLINSNSAWKISSLELRALIYAKQKDFDSAIASLDIITNDFSAPRNARERATDIKALYRTEKNRI